MEIKNLLGISYLNLRNRFRYLKMKSRNLIIVFLILSIGILADKPHPESPVGALDKGIQATPDKMGIA